MKNRYIIKIAELAFAIALSDQLIQQTKNGRLRNLYAKLEKVTLLEYKKIRRINNTQKKIANDLIKEFADASNWENKPKHIATKINFMLAIYDEREYARNTIKVLNDIYEYFERAKDAPVMCLWAGAIAAEKWNKILISHFGENYGIYQNNHRLKEYPN